MGYFKINKDPALDGSLKRKLNKAKSIMGIDNLSVTKFVNYQLESSLN